jgi:MSHA biogenesis protein MshL
MPQIDQGDTITLHVHPSVSSVSEVVKVVDLGGSIGSVRLPLPANSTNETDTVVRVTDGNIVAIGGLMQLQSRGSRSGLPGSTNVPLLSNLLGNQEQTGIKREIVVLIKPTIIRSGEDWRELARDSRDRIDDMGSARRVITIDGLRPAASPAAK